MKLSYSCTPNVKNLIKQHNSSIMKSSTNTDKKDSNCRNKNNYPLDEKCCIVLYALNAAVSTSNQTNTYFCSAEGYFESRYNNHTLSFRSHRYKHHTQLSKHVWPLKDSNTEFKLKWRIKTKGMPYKGSAIHRNVICVLLKKQQQLDLKELVQ